jgi:hypothetical protein
MWNVAKRLRFISFAMGDPQVRSMCKAFCCTYYDPQTQVPARVNASSRESAFLLVVPCCCSNVIWPLSHRVSGCC